MKKYLLTLLISFSLLSCANSENESNEGEVQEPANSDFIYWESSLYIRMHMTNGAMDIYENGNCQQSYLCKKISIVGEWPEYMYHYSYQKDGTSFTLNFKFLSPKEFTATVITNGTSFPLPETMLFYATSSVLDINGDGIIDVYQDL